MFMYVLVFVVLNWLVGCVVLSLIDRDDLILNWVEKSPLPFAPAMVASCWSIVLLHWVVQRGWRP